MKKALISYSWQSLENGRSGYGNCTFLDFDNLETQNDVKCFLSKLNLNASESLGFKVSCVPLMIYEMGEKK